MPSLYLADAPYQLGRPTWYASTSGESTTMFLEPPDITVIDRQLVRDSPGTETGAGRHLRGPRAGRLRSERRGA